jgi:trimeric autotransporter adhesin
MNKILPLALAMASALAASAAFAGSFTYRGQLDDGGAPAEGRYDLRVQLFADRDGQHPLATPVELHAVQVSGGAFAVPIDFGELPAHLQTGWLEVAVRSEADGDFWTLPDKAAITLKGGTCPAAWELAGNAGTNPASVYLGTSDNQALVLRVNNQRALRIEPHATSPRLIGGHFSNSITAVPGATIGGGGNITNPNAISGSYGTISGGLANSVQALLGSIGGGENHIAAGAYNTIGGGRFNQTGAVVDATIGGGASNRATGQTSTVGGGFDNIASALTSTIGGGRNNRASDADATVAGGQNNQALASAATIAGGVGNFVSLSANNASVGGGSNNFATGFGDSIAGGGDNTAAGLATSIGGGLGNQTQGSYSTVAGGNNNRASGDNASVAGGASNSALGLSNSIAGGSNNQTRGSYSTVGGGRDNCAGGAYNWVAGRRAKIVVPSGTASGPCNVTQAGPANTGNFVWADGNDHDFLQDGGSNTFSARATGGFKLVTAIHPDTGFEQAGVRLNAGSSSWASISDRHSKTDIEPLDARAVLESVAVLPMSTWRWKTEAEDRRHMGPMAQDFHAAFGLNGDDDRRIVTIDGIGVALAAIQGLNTKLESDNADLRQDNQALATRLAAVEARQQAELAALREEIALLRELVAPAVAGGAR